MRCLFCLLGAAIFLNGAPRIAGCAVFPADNVWNARIDKLPVDSSSAAYVSAIGADKPLHPDFGAGLYQGAPIGVPFIDVSGTQPKIGVTFRYDDESDHGGYPIPPNVPIEGGANSSGDRHVLVVDRDNCVLYELFAAYPQDGGGWRAGSGAIFDLKSNELRPATWTSADAAGLPIVPGLVRYDEVAAGEVRHAIRFTVPKTRKAYAWPARHYASNVTDAQYPPMGQRFRLKGGIDLSGFSRPAQVILRALQLYGMILADNGSAWFISGAPDDRWNNEILNELKKLHGSDFEAVDESTLMSEPDSGRVRASPAPVLSAVVNAASFASGAVAPGEIVSLFGAGFAANVAVFFDEVSAPVLFAQPDQIGAVVPYPMAGRTSAQAHVESSGAPSNPLRVPITAAAPGIFALNASGKGPGAILNQDYRINSTANPASAGSIISIFATGGGQTSPAGQDASIAGDRPPVVLLRVSVWIGGKPAEVLYAGGAPGLISGAMQVNARIPQGIPAGGSVPIVLTAGEFASQDDVTVSIK